MFEDVSAFLESAREDSSPPENLSPEAEAVWHAKAGNWEASHGIAQDLPGSVGCWIHAHLHLMEGDRGNASYWYGRAGRPARAPEDLEDEWLELARAALA